MVDDPGEVDRLLGPERPSLSKLAMRSAGGAEPATPVVVVSATNFTIACFAAPSFQDGSGSV